MSQQWTPSWANQKYESSGEDQRDIRGVEIWWRQDGGGGRWGFVGFHGWCSCFYFIWA